jgi:hypothetical protein
MVADVAGFDECAGEPHAQAAGPHLIVNQVWFGRDPFACGARLGA